MCMYYSDREVVQYQLRSYVIEMDGDKDAVNVDKNYMKTTTRAPSVYIAVSNAAVEF